MTDQPPSQEPEKIAPDKRPETPTQDDRVIDTTGWYIPDILDLDIPNCLLVEVPEGYKANILVVRWPLVTKSKGGIIYDYRSHKPPSSLAFVVKSGTYPIQRGDTIMAAEHNLKLELELSKKQIAFGIDVRDVVLLYPDPANPLEKRQPPNEPDKD